MNTTPSMLTIPYFFTEHQLHDPCSFSKSPLKPGLLARRLKEDPKFVQTGTRMIQAIEPSRLKQVHSTRYIDGLMDGTLPDGFGNKSNKDFQAIRTTVGNFVVAAEWALTQKKPGVTWSLTSGFHHACHDNGGGFCTIDALSLSAFELQKFHRARTLIVDGDYHFGNGVVDNIEKNQMGTYCAYLQYFNAAKYRAVLEKAIAKHNPTIIFYQAGADAWVGDPLGGALTMQELYQRDLDTFDVAKRHGIPVVCNLAGGYADNYEDTLRIHMNTGEAMKEVYLGYGIAAC